MVALYALELKCRLWELAKRARCVTFLRDLHRLGLTGAECTSLFESGSFKRAERCGRAVVLAGDHESVLANGDHARGRSAADHCQSGHKEKYWFQLRSSSSEVHKWGRLPVECGASYREHQGMPISSPSAQEAALVAFGKAVRAERAELGVSQEELALRSGIDRSYLGAIERGEQNAGLLHLIRIASALGVSLTKIVGEAGL